jgi:hypothetical protein
MALLVGMDEAGYGPHLGPLVVAAAALEFAGDAAPSASLWALLRQTVRRRPAGSSDRVVICDSKRAYSTANREAGLATLERTVLGFLAAWGLRPRTLADLLAMVAVGTPDAAPEPWHRPADLALPWQAPAEAVAGAARLLERGLGAAGAAAGRLAANVVPAARLNRLIADGGRNKAQALFAVTLELLADLRRFRPDADLLITMDQHGGRHHYADLLAGAFPMQAVETVEESADGSRYRLGPPPGGRGTMHLAVRQRAEERSLLAALASMAAKYLRELHMHQMNAFFQARVPNLKATAGYGRDARRFLEETRAARAAADLPLEILLRAL